MNVFICQCGSTRFVQLQRFSINGTHAEVAQLGYADSLPQIQCVRCQTLYEIDYSRGTGWYEITK